MTITPDTLPPAWADVARRTHALLDEEEPVVLDLPEGGRLFIDHAVPVLAVHRCAEVTDGDPAQDAGAVCAETHRLVTSQTAYLLATGGPEHTPALVAALADDLAARCGSLLVVDVWAPLDAKDDEDLDPFDRRPGFTIYTCEDTPALDAAAEALCDALSGIELAEQGADVARVRTTEVAPPGLAPVLPAAARRDGVAVLGLAVDAVFLNPREEEFYPRVLDRLRDALAPTFHDAAEAFARTSGIPGAPSLGRSRLEPAAEVADRGLSELSKQYGFLLQITPVNAREAWTEFRDSDGQSAPELLYRPLTFDPDALRRDLFALPLDEVEDVTVGTLLRERRDEIEAQVRMILDLETPQFLPGSLRVYGKPDADLVALAHAVIAAMPEQSASGSEVVGATAFAAEARAELDHYRAQFDGFGADLEIREDITAGLMVSHGQLLIGSGASIPSRRVPALLAHEVGTHVLTYYNGCAQPIRQLRHGLAGYEDLQEGLAVFAEWLVGGLTAGRFRTLAARVIGADALVDGASFVETHRLLQDATGLSARGAFNVTVRLYRGGGLTKDMVYLRGLRDLLAHLAKPAPAKAGGGVFWPLFIGKIALRHLDAITDLRERGVLIEPPLTPRYADDAGALDRLAQAQRGISVLDLLSS